MTFEDGIAYSRNVVAAKVALQLGEDTRDGVGDPPLDVDEDGLRGEDRDRRRGRGRGLVNDPTITAWQQIDLANGSFGQGVAVTPIQLATSFAAMVNGGTLVQPHVVKSIGTGERAPAGRGQVIEPSLSVTLTELMRHVVTEVPTYRDRTLVKGYDVGGKTGTAQIWDPTARDGRGDWKHNLFNYSFVGYIGREAGIADLVVAVRINEGTPSIARVGQLEMPVMSFELFRRIATDAITRPGLLPERRAPITDLATARPVRGPYATLDRVTDPAIRPGRRGRHRRSEADRGGPGRSHRRSRSSPARRRPILGGAVDSREVAPGNLFVALPGERTDGHAFVGAALAAGAAAAIVARPPDDVSLDDVDATVVQVDDPLRGTPRRRRRLAAPLRPARGRGDRVDREDVHEGGDRDGPRLGLVTLKNEGNQNNEIGLPLTVLRLRPGPPGRGPRDGHVRRRRDRRAGRDRAARDRRRDGRPAGPPLADRDDRRGRAGQGRARSRRCRPTASRS